MIYYFPFFVSQKCIWDRYSTRTWCSALCLNFYDKGKKTKQNRETPQICNTESGSCTLTIVTTLQINYSATKHRQEVEAQERNGVPASSHLPLTWDAIPSLEAEQASPTPRLGWVDTAWHGALCWTIFKGPLFTFWLGPESYMAWRPLEFEGKIQLTSPFLALGFPAQASFLRGQPSRHLHPQQYALDLEGISLYISLCEAFRGWSSESQALSCLLSHIPLHFTAQEVSWP